MINVFLDNVVRYSHELRIFPRLTLIWYLWMVTKVIYWYQAGTADQWLLTTVIAMSAVVIPVYSYSTSGPDKAVPFK